MDEMRGFPDEIGGDFTDLSAEAKANFHVAICGSGVNGLSVAGAPGTSRVSATYAANLTSVVALICDRSRCAASARAFRTRSSSVTMTSAARGTRTITRAYAATRRPSRTHSRRTPTPTGSRTLRTGPRCEGWIDLPRLASPRLTCVCTRRARTQSQVKTYIKRLAVC